MAPPVPALLDIPWSTSTVSVSIIDTSFVGANFTPSVFFGPSIPGFKSLDSGCWSFLIDHPDGRLVYDLGFPTEWENDFPPSVIDIIRNNFDNGATYTAPQYTSDILQNGGVSLDTIDAIIWSHTHPDHIGRPSLFPPSTNLIVGEGTLETFGLGYPDSPDSPYLARELANRTVREIPFPSNSTRIGGLAAFDYFGDGSFYILEAPGHEIGHVNALARISNDPPSFIYMGGDSFHHSSQLRPNRYTPLPHRIYLEEPINSAPNPVPGELFAKLHPSRRLPALPEYAVNLTSPYNTPFVAINVYDNGGSLARFPEIARDVISKTQAFDADDRILVVGAHDETLRGIIDLFPKKVDQSRVKEWKKRSRWQFLGDYDEALALLQEEEGREA